MEMGMLRRGYARNPNCKRERRARWKQMVLMVIHKVSVTYILTICKMEGFERSTKDLKSLKGRKICQQNLGTLNNNGKTDILVAKE